jgi:hypothetical protein
MTREAPEDIHTLLVLLQQHAHLVAGGPDDSSTLDSDFWARQNRYWDDLKQLRSDKASLETALATAT